MSAATTPRSVGQQSSSDKQKQGGAAKQGPPAESAGSPDAVTDAKTT